ncbi:MAG TPA: nucleoside hydrolase [Ktedonobacterales bacterium]|jgi:inosine-uridine nucleoside N-ribohydrolase|nr:nucleoside hydrolase [Ktedonobacterales bacterium]
MAKRRTATHADSESTQARQRIVLDCDPGHDDAIAILLAAHSPRLKLEAITTVAGNQTVEKTARNALKVCSLAGIRDVPIAAGMDRPLVREQRVAADIHGESGLDGPSLPEPDLELAQIHAVDLLIDLLLRSDGDLILVATGPLTNLATAMRREPRIVPKIQQIVLMGGAIGLGNTTPAAEFNIYVDPEAAHVVFNCGRPLTMIGLDVTHQAQATPEVRKRIRALGSPVAKLVDELLEFFASTYLDVFGIPSPPVHDPCAVAHVIDATLLQSKPMRVDIELHGEFTKGRTVCDVYGVTEQPPNADAGLGIDVPRFWDLLIETLATYPGTAT